ncbi:MAG: hypothetical protein ACYDH9_01325 [Limisphaerales bacterium]
MTPQALAAAADFLQHYPQDAGRRWSADDRAAQQEFVVRHLAGRRWLDWSTAESSLDLIQGSLARTPPGAHGRWPALVLAGPAAELLEPAALFERATAVVDEDGVLIGLMPCLRDNSPESQRFGEAAAASLWPYHTVEELLEALRDAGWRCDVHESRFVPIPQFGRTALSDQLGFQGFHRIFSRLEQDGYDPLEIGWGELRFVARSG